jgi:hypothetical protein
MKILISFVLLGITGLTGYAVVRSNKREEIHKSIADLRTELNKAEQEFLSPAPEDRAKYAEFLKQPDTGLIRLLPREIYDKPTELTVRGGGAYYSFAKLTHEYGYGSDIELSQNMLSVGFAGADYGFIIKTNDVSLQEITKDSPAASMMVAYNPAGTLPKARIEYRRVSDGFEENGINFRNRTEAIVGNTYLLRSVVYDTSDVLVAFQIVRKDQDGSMILAWKMLKKFDVPKLDRTSLESEK